MSRPAEVLLLLEVFHAEWLIEDLPARSLYYMDAQRRLTGVGHVQVIRV